MGKIGKASLSEFPEIYEGPSDVHSGSQQKKLKELDCFDIIIAL
jgi:hypothetical protein